MEGLALLLFHAKAAQQAQCIVIDMAVQYFEIRTQAKKIKEREKKKIIMESCRQRHWQILTVTIHRHVSTL